MADPSPIPVTAPVVEPKVMMPAPSGVLHVPPVDASVNVVPEPRHIAVVPVIATGAVFTYTLVAVRQPVGKV